MLVIHAVIPLDPETRDEALDIVEDLAEQSRNESGIIDYQVGTDIEDPNLLRFFEHYEDEDALTAHVKSDHFQSFQEQVPGLVSGRPDVIQFDVDSASELEL